jgi:hypothetical protein
MKLTVEEAEKRNLIGKVEVRLNGLTCHECVMADEEQCLVEVYDIERTKLYGITMTSFLEGDVWIRFLS